MVVISSRGAALSAAGYRRCRGRGRWCGCGLGPLSWQSRLLKATSLSCLDPHPPTGGNPSGEPLPLMRRRPGRPVPWTAASGTLLATFKAFHPTAKALKHPRKMLDLTHVNSSPPHLIFDPSMAVGVGPHQVAASASLEMVSTPASSRKV